MYTEKRKEERSVFARQPHGRMHILIGEQSRDVAEVQDVSLMGIRLMVDSPVEIGENLLIHYQTSGVDLRLNGTVVWNSGKADGDEHKDDSCVIGVKLASPSLLQAFW